MLRRYIGAGPSHGERQEAYGPVQASIWSALQQHMGRVTRAKSLQLAWHAFRWYNQNTLLPPHLGHR